MSAVHTTPLTTFTIRARKYMPDTSTTIFFATLGALVLGARYYFRSYSTSNTSSIGESSNDASAPTATPASAPREVTDDMVSVVQVVVPTISKEDIRKDLNETHSVEVTINRLLEKTKKKKGDTLFDRYGVDVTRTNEASTSSSNEQDENWVNVREKREEKLRKQKEEMLLKARKRSLELQNKST